MSLPSSDAVRRPRPRLVAAATLGVVAVAVIVLAVAGVFGGGSSTSGDVKLHLTASTTAAKQSGDAEKYPFGRPSSKPDYSVPQPPGQPTLVPTYGTKTTQRLYGDDPFQKAVSITQHIWPSVLAENAPGENDNDPDRPWALTLLTPDDPLTAITATPLIHFPNDAPVLYVTKNGIPQVTLNEIKRLGDTGISRYRGVDAFLVGAAANAKVEKQLHDIGLKTASVTAPNVPALANTVDKLYGSIQNPDTGVPAMGGGMENVMVGSMTAATKVPAAGDALGLAHGLRTAVGDRDSVPEATIEALKRRGGMARIYLFGGPNQISRDVAKQLSRVRDGGADHQRRHRRVQHAPEGQPDRHRDHLREDVGRRGEVGWKITGPGHGFTLVNENDWQAAVASAPLSHLGFHAPLLMTDSSGKLPPELEAYYESVAPTYMDTPADGPYNMHYIVGSWQDLTWPLQAHIDYISEMGNRRLWKQNTGGRYTDSAE